MAGQVLSELFTNRKENIALKFSEDCLYLNIYTPADLTKKSRLPVSGSFQPCGSSGVDSKKVKAAWVGVVSETPGLSLPTTAGPQDTQVFHTSVSPSDRCRDSGNLPYFCHVHCSLDNRRTRILTLRDKPILPLQVGRRRPRKREMRSYRGIGRTRAEAF